MNRSDPVHIIGAGLAGSEAAWQLARRGHAVRLHEMRPQLMTPAHKTEKCAELVCSNTFRSDDIHNAVGLLHEEMRQMGSLIMEAADHARIPAGSALAVDREQFSQFVTDALAECPLVERVTEEVTHLDDSHLTLVATGPLTSDQLYQSIQSMTGVEQLSFFDAIAPVIDADTVNMDIAYWRNRYDKGSETGQGDYLNCPMNREQYLAFIDALLKAEKVTPREFENIPFFEGCMPIEVMAERGVDTPRFGPMKPVGLDHPETGKKAYAVVQLRRDNRRGSLLNMVGFQTRMRYGEQLRVFRMIPGLEEAEFFRLGSLHRNTFIRSPVLLDATLRLKKQQNILFAGQITGVEGYVESAASGLMAGIFLHQIRKGQSPSPPPDTTAHGALLGHISGTHSEHFQPMNINFGLFPDIDIDTAGLRGKKQHKLARRQALSERALRDLKAWGQKNHLVAVRD
ncbi:MAG: methylenetetrahydrofolate--tRNA-(uracil(54)-C(5))-methyltransferase (FADH(2)-oxidizing) TrmFO [Gammaproteobacteria bacterium]|nr:MAG: methylenetetrahydrofolate--tRNA-(uracil(54)-C(5))-methyltransferase (FADH(2)-oxidizing) TrmFO [Gammaproteobacteria bacterium]